MIQVGTLLVCFEQRQVWHKGRALRVGARSLDILEVLHRANGSIVSKDGIMDAVWPGMVVEENRLQVHIVALRKMLGDDRELIKTVPGRGYMLVPQDGRAIKREQHRAIAACRGGLPAHTPALVGRNAEIGQIINLLRRSSVTTLVGAGGIGKTCLAVHVAHDMRDRFNQDVCFVELANASSRNGVLRTIANALQIVDVAEMATPEQLSDALAATPRLLVLDNAEHVIDVIASLIETLVATNQGLRVLVTSREPLHICAESLYRVDPLAVPAQGAPVDDILAHPAVELFLHRARAIAPACGADEASIALVADICRRLDGLPLAIELAAARVATLGVEGVASHLDDRFNLLTGGRRSALPRHQTLRATFDWSYAMLDGASRTLFRRLGYFAGTFTFDAACAITTDPEMPVAAVISGLGELAAKSLLTVEFRGTVAQYRLTKSTRAYAMEKLRDEGEVQHIAARHMQYVHECIEERALVTSDNALPDPTDGTHVTLDDARIAFEWAFSENGNRALGVALAGSFVGRLLEASLLHECVERAGRALVALESLPPGSVNAVCEMRLCSAYASTLLYTSDAVDETEALWHRVLELACEARDEAFEARALWGLWNTMLTRADIHASLRYATRLQQMAERGGASWQKRFADVMIAVSLHCFGEHAQARERLERTIGSMVQFDSPSTSCGDLAVDPHVIAYCTLARIAWLQGDSAEALQLLDECMTLLKPDTFEPSLSHLLAAVAVPISLSCSDFRAAQRYLGMLKSQVALNRFDVWHAYGECLTGHIDIAMGQSEIGIARLETGLRRLSACGFRRMTSPMVVVWAEASTKAGRFAQARTRLEDTLEYCKVHGEHFFVPELLRALGVTALEEARRARASGDLAQSNEEWGRRHLHEAMRLARAQDAHMCELRAALDLGQHLLECEQPDEVMGLIEAVQNTVNMHPEGPEIRRLAALMGAVQHSGAHSAMRGSQEAESSREAGGCAMA
jgi:predicted ATPase/DNA-binding winged helix-turn-helix (wHTH) protein